MCVVFKFIGLDSMMRLLKAITVLVFLVGVIVHETDAISKIGSGLLGAGIGAVLASGALRGGYGYNRGGGILGNLLGGRRYGGYGHYGGLHGGYGHYGGGLNFNRGYPIGGHLGGHFGGNFGGGHFGGPQILHAGHGNTLVPHGNHLDLVPHGGYGLY